MDNFTEKFQDLLDGTYDCVDRLVLNAYIYQIQSPGGFRLWWRNIFGEDTLDDTHLIRFAGRFSRRVRAWCKSNCIPLIDASAKQRHHELAEHCIPPKQSEFRGVYCVIAGLAPNTVFKVKRKDGIINNISKEYRFVKHYSFYLIDPYWGKIIIKINPHPPFNVNIILNGHEFVERKAKHKNIIFQKEANCFTKISSIAELELCAETMTDLGGEGRIHQLCNSWIYSACLIFLFNHNEQKPFNLNYSFSVSQIELSRNLLFQRGGTMEKVFNSVIDRTRTPLNIKKVSTIFGAGQRPQRKQLENGFKVECVVENHKYNLTVFKIHFGKLTVKMYSKGEHVLRIESIAHNVSQLKCYKKLDALPEIIAKLKKILERFMNILDAVDSCFIDNETIKNWCKPSITNGTRISGLDFNKDRISSVAKALIQIAAVSDNFTASDLVTKVKELFPDYYKYSVRNAGYDLRKFRSKGLIAKKERTRKYQINYIEIRQIAALLILREKVIYPLLANGGKLHHGRKPSNYSELDKHYYFIQKEVQKVFGIIGIRNHKDNAA